MDSSALGKVQAKAVSQLVSLTSIFLLPLVSIVPALLYLKMRQLGGETLTDVMAQVEDPAGRSRWEQRMRSRLKPPTPHQSA